MQLLTNSQQWMGLYTKLILFLMLLEWRLQCSKLNLFIQILIYFDICQSINRIMEKEMLKLPKQLPLILQLSLQRLDYLQNIFQIILLLKNYWKLIMHYSELHNKQWELNIILKKYYALLIFLLQLFANYNNSEQKLQHDSQILVRSNNIKYLWYLLSFHFKLQW